MIIQEKNIEKARKLINKLAKEGKKGIVKGFNSDYNRKILEMKNVSVLLPLPENPKDRVKERDSGLNHILCKIAAKNNIKIGIDLSELIALDKKEKAKKLSRISQNIKLCKKAGAKIIVINKAGKQDRDIFSLLLTLGADTKIAKTALQN